MYKRQECLDTELMIRVITSCQISDINLIYLIETRFDLCCAPVSDFFSRGQGHGRRYAPLEDFQRFLLSNVDDPPSPPSPDIATEAPRIR